MSKTKIIDFIAVLIVLVTIGLAWYFYQVLPDEVITHWNSKGEADDWGSKTMHVTLVPAIMIFLYLLFQWLPKIDPRRKNYNDFALAYKAMRLIMLAFFLLVFIMTSLVNLGYNIAIGQIISLGIGLMFIIFGIYMPKIKPNWFVGIRTPWTLSSDRVWIKTHKYGGKVFMLSGIIFLATAWLPEYLFGYSLGLAIILTLSSVVYSYFVYRNDKEKADNQPPAED